MTQRGLGREQIHDAAWGESYPHPLISCMMPGIALLTIAAVVLFGFYLWKVSLPADTIIPTVETLKVEDAERELKRASLTVDVQSQRVAHESIPEGAVVSQDPPSGQRVKSGRLVHLVVSAGSAFTRIPDVREVSEGIARQRLLDAAVNIATEEYAYHRTIAFDRVISITPAAGTKVQRSSTVNLIISKGPKPTVASDDRNTTELRTTTMVAQLPLDAADAAETRIDVTDDNGKRTVYQQTRNAGETLTETVAGSGPMTIEVYYNNRLLLTKKY